MKIWNWILTFGVCSGLGAFANSSMDELNFESTNLKPLVKEIETAVVTLKSPVSVYNWTMNGRIQNPSGFHIASQWSQTFWNSFGSPQGASNMYGFGLYGAVDPVASYGFGGGGDNWLLLELEMPAGFKMIDVSRATVSLSEASAQVLKSFDCPTDGNLDDFFKTGGSQITLKCQSLVKHIFKNIIKLDGFAYSYQRTNFKECTNYDGQKAFVIIDSKWMKPDLIKAYTAKTTDFLENRIRIQTLFLKANESDTSMVSSAKKPIVKYLNENPDSQYKGSKTLCSEDTCKITVSFCDTKGKCDEVELEPLPRPGGPLITSKEAKRKNQNAISELLWKDLEGQPKTSTISTWMKDNFYECVAKKP